MQLSGHTSHMKEKVSSVCVETDTYENGRSVHHSMAKWTLKRERRGNEINVWIAAMTRMEIQNFPRDEAHERLDRCRVRERRKRALESENVQAVLGLLTNIPSARSVGW